MLQPLELCLKISELLEYPSTLRRHCRFEKEMCVEKAKILIKGYQKFVIRICGQSEKNQPGSKNSFEMLKI